MVVQADAAKIPPSTPKKCSYETLISKGLTIKTIPKKPTPRQHHTKKIKHHTVAPVVPKKQRVKRIVPSKKEINRKKIEEAKRVARAKARREKEKKEREAEKTHPQTTKN